MDRITITRRLLASTLHVRFTRHPSFDLQERFGLTTVCHRLRTAALFFDVCPLQNIKDHCINAGLLTFTLQRPPARPAPSARIVAQEALDQYRSFCLPNAPPEFWTCTDRSARDRVRDGEIPLGHLLGYPTCCSTWNEENCVRIDETIVSSIIQAVGSSEPKALARAIESKIIINLPTDLRAPHPNAMQTLRQFPFVHHIACPSCLTSGESLTAQLNSQFEAFAATLSGPLHDALAEIGELARLHTGDLPTFYRSHFDKLEAIRTRTLSTIKP
jgi:hypothetical protein